MLERAVYVDLVTTGPDPRYHRVLEVAAVRVIDGREAEVYHALVNPGRAIPAGIARRTGIDEREVSAAPELRYVLPDLFRFLGTDPIVARDGERSVRAFLEAPFGYRLPNRFLDVAALEFLTDPSPRRPTWPRDPAAAPAAVPPPPRALDAARALVESTARLLARAMGWDPALRAEIGRLVQGTAFPWLPLYESVPPEAGPLRLQLPEADLSPRRPAPPPEPNRPIDADAIAGLFAADGALSRLKPGFEHRVQQAEMAAEVATNFNRGGVLLVEAGTGVGKSLAYLVPALLWARENGKPVIVSTHTKVLQGQLDRDLEIVRALLDWDFRAVVVKGRSNYLCLHRWHEVHQRTLEAADRAAEKASPPGARAGERMDEREAFAYALHWVQATEAGDVRDEMPLWMQERLPAGFLGQVTIDAEHCLGRRCPQYASCFVTRAREKAREADLVIVNHSLLLECLIAERDDILPHRGPIVLDEAHHLENVATAVLSAVSSRRALARVLREIWNPSDRSGLLPVLFRQLGHDPDPAVAEAVRGLALEGRRRVEELGPAGGRFFAQLQQFLRDVRLADENGGPSYAARVRVTDALRGLDGWHALREANGAVRLALTALYGLLHHLDVNVLGAGGDEGPLARVPRGELDGAVSQLGASRRAVQEMMGVHAQLFDDPQADRVYWLENQLLPDNEDGGQWEGSLHSAPLDVGPALEEYLFGRHPSVVLTSATLTTSSATDEFRFFKLRLGLDRLATDRVRYVKLLSPFDYGRQVLFLLIADLPAYSSRDRESRKRFFDAAREFLPRLLRANHGGTLVLCTSHEQLDYLHGPARDALAPLGINVLRQTRGLSTRRQVERFREDPDSVLFGTYGLWEGIDVPGESLDGLAVVKLPFDPPTDPLVEARREQTVARGLDGNHHYYYPLAIMRLKQGFGRLIRSTTDRGVFAVLDNRLATRAPYARQFLNSLPPGMQEFRLVEAAEALRLVELWRRRE